MSRIDDVKTFAKNAPYSARIAKLPIDSMIDAMIAEFHKEMGMERLEVEENITKVELLRNGASSITLRLGGGGFGHPRHVGAPR
jgi:hypothetical protein